MLKVKKRSMLGSCGVIINTVTMDLEEEKTAISYTVQGRFHGSVRASADHSKN